MVCYMTAKILNYIEWRKILRPNDPVKKEWAPVGDDRVRFDHVGTYTLDIHGQFLELIRCTWCNKVGYRREFVCILGNYQYCSFDCWDLDNPG